MRNEPVSTDFEFEKVEVKRRGKITYRYDMKRTNSYDDGAVDVQYHDGVTVESMEEEVRRCKQREQQFKDATAKAEQELAEFKKFLAEQGE